VSFLSGRTSLTTVQTGDIADDAVTLAKMAHGTASQNIAYDGSGIPVDVAAAGGGWEYVSTATASASATLSFTNMADGYDYEYICEQLLPATDNTTWKARLGIAGPTYRTSLYQAMTGGVDYGDTSQGDDRADEIRLDATGGNIGNGTYEGVPSVVLSLRNPANASELTSFSFLGATYSGSDLGYSLHGGGLYATAEAHTSIVFLFHVGNITSGRILQYRRARS